MADQPRPRPVFVYGTLRVMPLLARLLTGDASNASAMEALATPARVDGYARYSITDCPFPAAVKQDDASVDGCLLALETEDQREKLDVFEGGLYEATCITAILETGDKVEADMYVWNSTPEIVTDEPWDLDTYVMESFNGAGWMNFFGKSISDAGDDEESYESDTCGNHDSPKDGTEEAKN